MYAIYSDFKSNNVKNIFMNSATIDITNAGFAFYIQYDKNTAVTTLSKVCT